MSLSSKRCWATVDLLALSRNVARIRASLPRDIKYISVVKADAYGHGLPQVVPRLMQSFVDYFAVANVQEAAAIRELGVGWPILIMSSLLPDEDPYILEYNLTPHISADYEVERFEKLGSTNNHIIDIHLKVDTGMGRLGVWYEQLGEVYLKIQKSSHLKLKGIYTHFSSADKDPEFTQHQRTLFKDSLRKLKNLDKEVLIHADNSAGLATFSKSNYVNAVRLGIIQFGILAHQDSSLEMLGAEPVLSLKSRIGLIKDLPQGASVSYGRTFKLSRPSKIAIVTAGYGDGIAMGLSNKGQVLINGQRFPIIGRITMDMTIIDITNANRLVRVGDEVTLIGQDGNESIGITEWSRWADTIEWDIYCSITKRVPRIYLNNAFS